MAEDIQKLLEKIQKDGIEKAGAEAEKIISAARAKAAETVAAAEEAAAKRKAEAEAEAAAFAARAEESVRQAARDVVLGVEKSVAAILENALAKNVDAALADPAKGAALAAQAVSEIAADGAEIAAAPELVEAIRAQVAAKGTVKVVTDEAAGTGFSVRLDGGRVEYDFKGPAVAQALAQRLRPRLAALVKA